MASEIRVNQIQSRTGVSTVSFTDSGPVISGVTTVQGSINVTDGITGNLTGTASNATGITTTQITVGDSFIKAGAVGLGTTDTTGRNAGVGTAVGTLIYNATENVLQVYTGTRWETGVTYQTYKATGGTVSLLPSNKVIHTFTSSGTFQIIDTNLSSVEVFMVGGGGGGGTGQTGLAYGSGGGAGALHYRSSHPVSSSPGSYSIVVGAGGARGPASQNTDGSKGEDTTFDTLTCEGGGRGAGQGNGGPGGSGAGGAYPSGTGGTGSGDTGGTDGSTSPVNGWGHDGAAYVSAGQGGGGGGAGGLASGSSNVLGGIGLLYSISGISTTYAAGGGGSNFTSAYMYGANTGGGGNGGFPGGNNAGESGIVIISYPS